MFSLRLRCTSDEAEALSIQLWDAGTAAISEAYEGDVYVLIAGFEDAISREALLRQFAPYRPEGREDRTDWEEVTREAWPGRAIGRCLYLAPPWSEKPTPEDRYRVIHNPGQASGTGEHPCTQLALEALERTVFRGCTILDVGSGSGILAIAGMKLGSVAAVGLDPDEIAIEAAKGNFRLNGLSALLAVGSADCVRDGWSDLSVANISATVLLSIMDELVRVTASKGTLILTGFPRSEAAALTEFWPDAELTHLEDWACLTVRLS